MFIYVIFVELMGNRVKEILVLFFGELVFFVVVVFRLGKVVFWKGVVLYWNFDLFVINIKLILYVYKGKVNKGYDKKVGLMI